MLLALDIGNTNIRVGLFEAADDAPRYDFCLATDARRSSDEYALLLRTLIRDGGYELSALDGVVVGSVVPTVTDLVLGAVKRMLPEVRVTVVGPGVKTGFPIRLSDPSELGADLAANAAGAMQAVGAPVVIVDLGTATVVSAVDKDGAFAGGSILPGVRMSFEALGETGLLPTLSHGNDVPVVGRSTEGAMRSGVLYGQAIAVTGLVERFLKMLALPGDTPVVLSGGYAAELRALLPKSYKEIPLLTLRGLARIYRLNERKR